MKTFAALILAIAVALCVIGPASARPHKHHHWHLAYTCPNGGTMTLYPVGSAVSSYCPRTFSYGGLLVGGPR